MKVYLGKEWYSNMGVHINPDDLLNIEYIQGYGFYSGYTVVTMIGDKFIYIKDATLQVMRNIRKSASKGKWWERK